MGDFGLLYSYCWFDFVSGIEKPKAAGIGALVLVILGMLSYRISFAVLGAGFMNFGF